MSQGYGIAMELLAQCQEEAIKMQSVFSFFKERWLDFDFPIVISENMTYTDMEGGANRRTAVEFVDQWKNL